jgi:hypothetical protein
MPNKQLHPVQDEGLSKGFLKKPMNTSTPYLSMVDKNNHDIDFGRRKTNLSTFQQRSKSFYPESRTCTNSQHICGRTGKTYITITFFMTRGKVIWEILRTFTRHKDRKSGIPNIL